MQISTLFIISMRWSKFLLDKNILISSAKRIKLARLDIFTTSSQHIRDVFKIDFETTCLQFTDKAFCAKLLQRFILIFDYYNIRTSIGELGIWRHFSKMAKGRESKLGIWHHFSKMAAFCETNQAFGVIFSYP